jgi:hypothetical protein
LITKIHIYDEGGELMYPELYNDNGELQAVLDNIISDSAFIKRVINGEFTFSFDAFESELKSEYFDPSNNIVIDDQTFDIKYIEQQHDNDIKYSIQCEHVNYRMLDGSDNLYKTYLYIGTPVEILSDILLDTEFAVGTVSFIDSVKLEVNTEITRKALIYELADLVGGEIEYTNKGFTINLLDTIGKDNGFEVRFGKNLKGIKKIVDKRGELKTSYSVDIVELKNSTEYIEKGLQGLEVIDVGDTVRIVDEIIGLDIRDRIVSLEYNPIYAINTKLEISNTINRLANAINRMANDAVNQNKIYNGVHINSDEGFVSTREDQKVKTSMNAKEGLSIFTDYGSGLQRVFFVDVEGRLQAKEIDIDGSGLFMGSINVINGKTVVKIAPTGGNPFEITFDGTPIVYVDTEGNGVYSGKVSASKIEGSTFIRRGLINDTEMDVCSIDDNGFVYLPTDATPFQLGFQIMYGYIRSTWNELQLGPTGLGITINNNGVTIGGKYVANPQNITDAIAEHVLQYHSNP